MASSAIVFFSHLGLLAFVVFAAAASVAAEPSLTLDYYSKSCPSVLEVVRKEMESAVASEPRNAASVLRLHFHDCFVQGCDGSVLLDDTATLKGEKKAPQSVNSLRGYEIIDGIKNRVESDCPGVVSCADILTIAARDAVILVGGPYWDVPLGRKDAKTASFTLASENIPSPDQGLVSLLSNFLYQGLSATDLVALSGAHTIGKARCKNFRARIYGDFPASSYLSELKSTCPVHGGEDSTAYLDHQTPNLFDNSFFQLLVQGEGLLDSDQEMYSSLLGTQTRDLVVKYAHDSAAFFWQFSDSMIKMGNITNAESFTGGEVRRNCRFVNT